MSRDSRAPRGTSRRAVLAGALGGWALATLPALPTRNELIARIRALLNRADHARSPAGIVARAVVFGPENASGLVEHLTDAEIGTRIRNNIAADYRDGRLVDFHGWRIAQTESQALVLLRQTRRA